MKLYVIKTFDELLLSSLGRYKFSNYETAFIFSSKEEALQCIKENSCDFQDHSWSYCVLEEIDVGQYLPFATTVRRIYYRFEKGEWKCVTKKDLLC